MGYDYLNEISAEGKIQRKREEASNSLEIIIYRAYVFGMYLKQQFAVTL